jgi:hypothetical protein
MTKERLKVERLDINYEGIALVLAQIVELYKVCDNKELVDEALRMFIHPQYLFNPNDFIINQ